MDNLFQERQQVIQSLIDWADRSEKALQEKDSHLVLIRDEYTECLEKNEILQAELDELKREKAAPRPDVPEISDSIAPDESIDDVRRELRQTQALLSRTKLKYDRVKKTATEWKVYAERLEAKIAINEGVGLPKITVDPASGVRKVVPPTQPLEAILRSFERPSQILFEDLPYGEATDGHELPELPELPALPEPDDVPTTEIQATTNAEHSGSRDSTQAADSGTKDAGASGNDLTSDETAVDADEQERMARVKSEEPTQILPRADIHKRKRTSSRTMRGESAEIPAPMNLIAPIIIKKSEPGSSPIIVSMQAGPLRRITDMDLDEVGSRVDTPRKRRKYKTMRNESMRGGVLRSLHQERSFSVPFEESPKRLSQGSANMITDYIASDPVYKEEPDDPDRTLIEDEELLFADGEPQMESPTRPTGPLQPVDNNERLLPEPRSSEVERRKRRSDAAIEELAEDGLPVQAAENGPPVTDRSMKKIKAEGRLSSLLTVGPTPSKAPIKSAMSAKSSDRAQKSKPMENWSFNKTRAYLAAERDTPSRSNSRSVSSTLLPSTTKATATTSAAAAMSFPAPTRGPVASVPSPRVARTPRTLAAARPAMQTPLKTPLRSQPVAMLKLSDFKINPKASPLNIANREERRHMPGCTDPNCPQGCGKVLRALAAELPITVPRTLFSSQDSGEDTSNAQAHSGVDSSSRQDGSTISTDDHRLLRWHLGTTYDANVITKLDVTELNELILQAKTRLMADRHGRHKARVERQKSPPGFWRTDMPSTQELDKERQEAAQREKDEVRDRWLESMRADGVWRFRDE